MMLFKNDRVTWMKGNIYFKPRPSRLSLQKMRKINGFQDIFIDAFVYFTAKWPFFFLNRYMALNLIDSLLAINNVCHSEKWRCCKIIIRNNLCVYSSYEDITMAKENLFCNVRWHSNFLILSLWYFFILMMWETGLNLKFKWN